MKFMIIRKADADTEAGVMPSDELLSAMARYNEELANAGVMVAGEGLQPSSRGARVRFSKGKPAVTDGPFAETKELVAGYTMIRVGSKQEAIDWARRWPPMDGNGEVELELRQVFELEDFEQSEGLEQHRALGERLARQPSLMCPYLLFDGHCREAVELYADCLGGHIEMMMTTGETPMAAETNERLHDRIAHARLRVGSWMLMASDCPPEYYKRPQGLSVQIALDDVDRARQAFERLAEGGQVQMPFEETFWAHGFGTCTDRYGTPWMINCLKEE